MSHGLNLISIRFRSRSTATLGCLVGLAIASVSLAQEGYRKPPQEIVKILKAPRLPSVSIDPTNRTMMLIHRQTMPTISDMSQPMLRLAGRRINPNTNSRHGNSGLIGLTLKDIESGRETVVDIPDGVRLGFPRWSPDGSKFAFTVTNDDGVWLCVGDTATGDFSSFSGQVNGVFSAFSWMPNSTQLLVHFLPIDRPEAPQRSPVPTGPVIQEASGRTSPVRTYQDLLGDAHDEALMDYYFTSQLAIVDLAGAERKLIGEPAVYGMATPSPTGRYLLVSRVVQPYSYQVTMRSFPAIVEVRDLQSGAVHELVRKPLGDQVPIGGVITGPRSHQWQATAGLDRIVWVEALDDGDPKKDVPQRDRIMLLADPMAGEAVEIARLEDRYAGITWIHESANALISEYDRDERWTRTWKIRLSKSGALQSTTDPKLLWERNVQDRYADPGRPVMITNSAGRSVARRNGDWLFMSGSGATPNGDRPFLSRINLESLETSELWRCEGENLESFVELLADRKIITRYETPIEPPNYYVRNLDDDTRTAITHFEHPAPQLRDIHKEMVTYKRDDGVELSATLYLPPGYEEGRDGPLPLVVWAYPLEFNDAYTAGQVRGSPYRFTSIGGSSHLFLLLRGYAIMDRATMPVVGSDPETVNDTFIDQIVASAKAAIDYAAERGVGDPNRVGVGGHSYGAFMTANLLAHCDLFRAGIARSGAYNRSLTPFGFQSERRTFWEAPEIYFKLSPFMHADKINEPILLIHGQRDNNSGTFPIQSQRLYHAVKGHGGTVRLVMLPAESHGYRAEESIMHVLAEMIDWFDKHVKLSAQEPASGS